MRRCGRRVPRSKATSCISVTGFGVRGRVCRRVGRSSPHRQTKCATSGVCSPSRYIRRCSARYAVMATTCACMRRCQPTSQPSCVTGCMRAQRACWLGGSPVLPAIWVVRQRVLRYPMRRRNGAAAPGVATSASTGVWCRHRSRWSTTSPRTNWHTSSISTIRPASGRRLPCCARMRGLVGQRCTGWALPCFRFEANRR